MNSKLYPIIAESNRVFPEGASIYEDDGKFHYVYMERGSESKHFIENNIMEILYYVFNDITFSLAIKYELEHRNKIEDFRKILFGKQLELLGNINMKYRKRRDEEISAILEKAPYQDL